MNSALTAAVTTLFNDPNGSEAGLLYLQAGLKPLPVRVLRRGNSVEGEVAGSCTLSAASTFEVMKSACSPMPPRGSVLRLGAEGWMAFDVQSDERKGTWVMACNAV